MYKNAQKIKDKISAIKDRKEIGFRWLWFKYNMINLLK